MLKREKKKKYFLRSIFRSSIESDAPFTIVSHRSVNTHNASSFRVALTKGKETKELQGSVEALTEKR